MVEFFQFEFRWVADLFLFLFLTVCAPTVPIPVVVWVVAVMTMKGVEGGRCLGVSSPLGANTKHKCFVAVRESRKKCLHCNFQSQTAIQVAPLEFVAGGISSPGFCSQEV